MKVWLIFTIIFLVIMIIGFVCKGIMPKVTKSFNNILIDTGMIGTIFYGMLFIMCLLG